MSHAQTGGVRRPRPALILAQSSRSHRSHLETCAAFATRVNYSSFAVAVSEEFFVSRPHMLVPLLRGMPCAEVRRRQQALAEARPQIIFEAANSTRAAANFLEQAVSRCFPRMANRSLRCDADGSRAKKQKLFT